MKELDFHEMPKELEILFREYFQIFGTYPDHYAELGGACREAYDAKLVKQAIDEKRSLPKIILGDDYGADGATYG